MKAMILAAGLGTRLRPLTDSRPKALVELGGRTLLEIALDRLRRFGVTEAVVNVHHFAEQVVNYLAAHDNFGMRIAISREDELLLDTGGGLLHAADFFLRDVGSDEQPFLLHNVDVLSAIDLHAMLQLHRERNALATLAVQHRDSSRQLLFDAEGRLRGRRTAGKPDEMASEFGSPRLSNDGGSAAPANLAPSLQAWGFAGIHVLSLRIFARMREQHADCNSAPQAFPIVPEYLRLAAAGERIVAFPCDGCYWRDLGTPASLRQADEEIERKQIEL